MAAASVCVALLSAQSGGITAKDAKAKEALDAAYKALGGADKIGDVNSLVIKGTSTQLFSNGYISPSGIPLLSTPEKMEIRILLPDSFVIIRQMEMGVPSYRGVSHGIMIPPRRTEASTLNPETPGDVIRPEKIESFAKYMESNNDYDANIEIDKWSRFLMGLLMKAGSTPLTISSGSAPSVLTLTKNDDALGEIEFDSKTGCPSGIRYKNPEPPFAVLKGSQGLFKVAPGLKPEAAMDMIADLMGDGYEILQIHPKEDEMRFQNRFSVNGIMFPRVITTTESDRDVITEWRIEEVRINPELSLKDFEVP